MKFIKSLFFLSLTLIILFLLTGLIKPTVHYGHEIEVLKPIQEAWAVHKDDTKFTQWLEGFKSIEHIDGEYDKVGSTYKVIVNPGEGQADFEMIETIVGIEKFKYVNLKFDSDMMVFEQKSIFEEFNGVTTIRTESNVTGNNIIMKSMFALMEMFTGSFQAQEEKNINALKRVIEENTKDYYSIPVKTMQAQ